MKTAAAFVWTLGLEVIFWPQPTPFLTLDGRDAPRASGLLRVFGYSGGSVVADAGPPVQPLRRCTMDDEATCVKCGCTASRACDEGCSWVWVNRKTRKGLCTTCADKE